MADPTPPDRRTTLAEDRTTLAKFRTGLSLERTTLAWIRTTVTMTTFGLGTIGFFRSLRQANETPRTIRLQQAAVHLGVTLVVIGLIATLLVAINHFSAVRKLRAGILPVTGAWPLSITVSVLLALLSMLILFRVFYT